MNGRFLLASMFLTILSPCIAEKQPPPPSPPCCCTSDFGSSPSIVAAAHCPTNKMNCSSAATKYFLWLDAENSKLSNKMAKVDWNYETNITDWNSDRLVEEKMKNQAFEKAAWENVTCFVWEHFKNRKLRRAFKLMSTLGDAALNEEKYKRKTELVNNMTANYGTAKICRFKRQKVAKDKITTHHHHHHKGHKSEECNLQMEPDLTRMMAESRNYDELAYLWKSWRDVTGKPVRKHFWEFKQLSNEAAKLNGFEDAGAMWRDDYECCIFEETVHKLWEQVMPLYKNLHAYVRRKLRKYYGADKIRKNGPIPAHILGNMWAQEWSKIMDIVKPFPKKPSMDVTPALKAKNMTVLAMVKMAEEFFTSLGLKPMTKTFWKKSIFERPKGRKMVCHASAHDFSDGTDFRIKMCAERTEEDFITMHHEMGHIQYFMQYAHLPQVFRQGANPGFHEAIGDVLALSVSTPSHMKKIGLLKEVAQDSEADINYLMAMALKKVVFLPYAYAVDLWRWELFGGNIHQNDMNRKWWQLRLKYQGVCPPVARTEEDFDPASKFHVSANVPYIRYFVSYILQFQIHEALCKAAGHRGPLHQCDIYQSKDAGKLFSKGMELGCKEHWCKTIEVITAGASKKLDAGPLLRYFQPLFNFLKERNEEEGEPIGWKSEDPMVCDFQ